MSLLPSWTEVERSAEAISHSICVSMEGADRRARDARIMLSTAVMAGATLNQRRVASQKNLTGDGDGETRGLKWPRWRGRLTEGFRRARTIKNSVDAIILRRSVNYSHLSVSST